MSGTITMTGEEYDAIRAEAEALRAENGRLREVLEFAVREQSGDLPIKEPSAWLLRARNVLAETASND